MTKEIKTVINNGITIPNECNCIWCGEKMKRAGENYIGSGVNQFALFCNNCGAVVIHAKDFHKKINGFSIKFNLQEDK